MSSMWVWELDCEGSTCTIPGNTGIDYRVHLPFVQGGQERIRHIDGQVIRYSLKMGDD